jgi:tRNA(Ile)-lysidine synthase
MTAAADPGAALEAARTSGLIQTGEPLLVMLSGGADSVCLLDVALRLGADVTALHANYGLREAAEDDERHCRDLCVRLGVELIVEAAPLTNEGNVQAAAREARYRLAELHARGDYAAAHTASDQAETVLYRLAVSPGRRPLLGMAARRGHLVRPLLAATAAETRAHCRARGLEWREDASNRDPRFARARVRHGLLEVLREVAPGAEHTIAETSAQLRDEAEALDMAVDAALAGLGGGPAVDAEALAALGPGLSRLVLRRLAERETVTPHPLSRADVDAVLALAGTSGSRSLDLGNGLRALAEYGTLRFQVGAGPAPAESVALTIPGSARFGTWEVEARLGPGGDVELDADALGQSVTVRAWRDGDRIRPLGLNGTKTLQDLFTDRKIPRELRRTLPVIEAQGEIAWVAGVALSERFAPNPATKTLASLSARSK